LFQSPREIGSKIPNDAKKVENSLQSTRERRTALFVVGSGEIDEAPQRLQ
jgi:hypothetical protein